MSPALLNVFPLTFAVAVILVGFFVMVTIVRAGVRREWPQPLIWIAGILPLAGAVFWAVSILSRL